METDIKNIPVAMILAAGFGMRMRPLTLETPKPLLEVGGRAMLTHVLDHVRVAGVKQIVVNGHYKADKIADHVQHYAKAFPDVDVQMSYEDEVLDTGGGVKQALPLLGDTPFFVINADLPWVDDGEETALQRMMRLFDPVAMDALLLVMPVEGARGFGDNPMGDFCTHSVEGEGELLQLSRSDALDSVPHTHVFVAAQIIRADLYKDMSQKVFSNLLLWEQAQKAGRLYGVALDGRAFHVGTPQDLAAVNRDGL